MTNTTLLSKILKTTNKLITSEEYKLAYSIGNSFSRNRKLSFSNIIYFICSALRNSISSEIANFIVDNSNLNFPNISKQAFSKARQKSNFSRSSFNRTFNDQLITKSLLIPGNKLLVERPTEWNEVANTQYWIKFRAT